MYFYNYFENMSKIKITGVKTGIIARKGAKNKHKPIDKNRQVCYNL